MSKFASTTVVPVVRTKAEIEKVLVKYGAKGFMFGQSENKAVIIFDMNNRRIKFSLEVGVADNLKARQLERTRWRCLLLAIKAKLECTASGISTFEQEFMAHVVMPNGLTVGENISPMIAESYRTNKMLPLLGGKS